MSFYDVFGRTRLVCVASLFSHQSWNRWIVVDRGSSGNRVLTVSKRQACNTLQRCKTNAESCNLQKISTIICYQIILDKYRGAQHICATLICSAFLFVQFLLGVPQFLGWQGHLLPQNGHWPWQAASVNLAKHIFTKVSNMKSLTPS